MVGRPSVTQADAAIAGPLAPRGLAALLWILTLLFSLRVAGQALQLWAPQTFLPPFATFQGSSIPYPILLSVQLAILAVMAICSGRATAGTLTTGHRTEVVLAWAGAIYLALALTRLAIGLSLPTAPPWFRSWISSLFHIVLALFVLTLAAWHRRQHSASKGRT